jgi:uncharacterized protein (TIGR03437 family)
MRTEIQYCRRRYCGRAGNSHLISAAIVSLLLGCPYHTAAQTNPNPVRWQAKYTQIYSNDFETKTGPSANAGLQLQGSSVITDPSLVIAGNSSLLISNRGGFVSVPAVLPLAGNTVYTIQFDYRIVAPTTTTAEVFYAWFQPTGTTDSHLSITIPPLLKNAAVTGTFSTGVLTASASSYMLQFYGAPGVSLVVDNFLVYRQDVTSQTSAPPAWSRLSSTPFPRLGKYMLGNTAWTAEGGVAEGKPFTYTVQQVESRLAFHDVIAGLAISNQTWDPDSIHRIRALNPNAVILPYRIFDSQNTASPRSDGNIDLDYQFFKSTPNEWKATDTAGNVIYEANFPGLFYMNLSDLVPVVNGQIWRTALPSFVSTQVFPSGLWDGIFFDNLQGTLDGNFPNLNDPSRFNYDWNRNGLRDETPASTSEMQQAATIKALQQLNSSTGGLQLTMGNGAPQFALAPMVNGYTFECFNFTWNQAGAPISSSSPGEWMVELDSYLRMVAASRPPQINVLEACGANGSDFNSVNVSHAYLTPTPEDLQRHRFSMGTALLGDGFYSYDLFWNTSAPYWFDEYSVDSSGNAVEDRAKKGYLGHPLTEATELTTPATPVLQDGFEGSALSNSWIGNPASGVTISHGAADVISGGGSLVISNPDHTQAGSAGVQTNPTTVPLTAGSTYLLTFDWRILETIDDPFGFLITLSSNGQNADYARVPGVVAGDFGTVHFPFTVPSGGEGTLSVLITGGGGKVAIDNVGLSLGGVGPWRRDFENGLVVVNPLGEPHTFAAAELAGAINRTGIHRIKGTQAPDVNSGQSINGSLTLGPFDAIILLSDPIHLTSPTVTAVLNAAGGQPGVASGAFVSIYGSNFTPLPYDDWSNSIINGQLPKQLDDISVTIGGKPAYVYAVTPGQINVQAPDVGNGPVQVVVTTGGGSSAPFSTNSLLYSPAFFPWPGNQPVATHLDYSIAAKNGTFAGLTAVPAKPGEVITLWGTGFGPTNPAVSAGQEPTVAAPATQSPVTVTLGGTSVPVLGAVLSSYAAVYQIAIQIPASMPDGDYPIVATVNGVQSPANFSLTVQ